MIIKLLINLKGKETVFSLGLTKDMVFH